MKKLVLLLLIIFFQFPSLIAQSLNAKVSSAYASFIKDEQLKFASASLTVLNANGDVVFSENGQTGLAPASTLKTVTSATALATLGADYQFKTQIYIDGTVKTGILSGNVIIHGSGDPTLGSDRYASTKKEIILKKIFAALKAQGINKIDGYIVADDAIWDTQALPQGWIWQDMGNYYGAATNPICWGENEFELNFSPSKIIGSLADVSDNRIQYPFFSVDNEVKTGAYGSGDQVYGYSSPYSNRVFLRGTYGADLKKAIRFSLPDAAMAMAFEVDNYLKNNGLQSLGYTTSKKMNLNIPQGEPILEILSLPLKDIVYQLNQKSINLYAEQLLRILSNSKKAEIEKGIKNIKSFWESRGIDERSLNIIDGSGLSPANRVTTQALANVLLNAKKQPWFDVYYNSLPVYNGIKMKSGTIGDVLAYAGYINGYCFSVMVNNYNGSTSQMRQKIYNLLNTLK